VKHMKKITSIMLIALLFTALLAPVTVHAAGEPLIVDDVGKITERSLSELNEYAREISDTYQIDVAYYLVENTTGQSLPQYITSRYQNVEKHGPDGIALAHDLENRKWTCVSFGRAKELISEDTEDRFWDAYDETDTYYEGVLAYLEDVSAFLAEVIGDNLTAAGAKPETPGKPAPGTATEATSDPASDPAPGAATEPATDTTSEPAAGMPGSPEVTGSKYVFDETGTLTRAQIATLNEKSAALTRTRMFDAYIWIVDLVPEENARTIDAVEAYVDAFYDRNSLGYGDDRSGMVLLLEIGDIPGERDYLFMTRGSCTTLFSNSARESLLDNYIVPKFRNAFSDGNFFGVADAFLDAVESRLSASEARNAVYPEAVRNGYVFDATGTLTSAQIAVLNEKSAALAEKRKCDAYIWIVQFVPEPHDRNVDALEAYVDAFYMRNNLGYGDDRNGMVLLLEIGDIPGERDYLFYTYGPCTSVFDNSRRADMLYDYIIPQFRRAFDDGNFFGVADTFLVEVEENFAAKLRSVLSASLLIIVLVPVFIAFIVCRVWKKQMKTAKIATSAGNYIPEGGFRLKVQSDVFLYRTTTREKIEHESSSSDGGGGGGSSSSSSGRSSGGKV